ncbi:MAG: hypothetical protein WEB00_12145 [Dehalococcoidia bacterium]
MKHLAVLITLAAVALAVGSLDWSGEAPPSVVGAEEAGVPPPYYLKSLTGAGSGGANQVSSLTVSCNQPHEAILAGGFASVDEGTHISQNHLAAIDPDGWRAAWVNNGTVDSVTVRAICFRGNPARETVTITSSGTANQPTTVEQNCFGTVLSGGFRSVADGTTIIESAPQVDGDWTVTWKNPTVADTIKVSAHCWQSASAYPRSASKTVGPGEAGSLSLSCNAADIVAGIGFSSIEAGDHLIGARVSSLTTATISWVNGASTDPTGIRIVCLDVT